MVDKTRVNHFFLLAGLLLLLVSACGQGPPESLPTPAARFSPGTNFRETPCRVNPPVGITLTCGKVEVPQDYRQPDGSKLELSVVIAHSKSDNPSQDPVIFLPVSPGMSGLRMMEFLADSFGFILKDRDMVFYDPRGVGDSDPTLKECQGVSDIYFNLMGEGLTREDLQQPLFDSYLACRDQNRDTGFALEFFTTEQHAADLNSIRVALGYPDVNLLGNDYGYELAMSLVNESPEGVRSVTIASADELAASYPQKAANLQRSLDLVFKRCRASQNCQKNFPELEDQFYKTVMAFNDEPTPLKINRRGSDESFEITVSGDVLIELTRMLLSSSEGIASLPDIISNMALERSAILNDSVLQMAYRQSFSETSPQMSSFCQVVQSVDESDLLDQPAQTILLENNLNTYNIDRKICENWFSEPVPFLQNLSVSTSIPFMILQGEYDSVLPVGWIMENVASLPNATVIEVPHTGEQIDWNQACITRLVGGFLNAPSEPLDTTCIEDIPKILFVMPE